jgi:hypothetical protein
MPNKADAVTGLATPNIVNTGLTTPAIEPSTLVSSSVLVGIGVLSCLGPAHRVHITVG